MSTVHNLSSESASEAVIAIASLAKSLLANPESLKCVVDDSDDHVFIRDVCVLLETLQIEHPVGDVLLNTCQSHHKVYGCGTKTLLAMIAIWMDKAKHLTHMGIPVTELLPLMQAAAQLCVKEAMGLAIPLDELINRHFNDCCCNEQQKILHHTADNETSHVARPDHTLILEEKSELNEAVKDDSAQACFNDSWEDDDYTVSSNRHDGLVSNSKLESFLKINPYPSATKSNSDCDDGSRMNLTKHVSMLSSVLTSDTLSYSSVRIPQTLHCDESFTEPDHGQCLDARCSRSTDTVPSSNADMFISDDSRDSVLTEQGGFFEFDDDFEDIRWYFEPESTSSLSKSSDSYQVSNHIAESVLAKCKSDFSKDIKQPFTKKEFDKLSNVSSRMVFAPAYNSLNNDNGSSNDDNSDDEFSACFKDLNLISAVHHNKACGNISVTASQDIGLLKGRDFNSLNEKLEDYDDEFSSCFDNIPSLHCVEKSKEVVSALSLSSKKAELGLKQMTIPRAAVLNSSRHFKTMDSTLSALQQEHKMPVSENDNFLITGTTVKHSDSDVCMNKGTTVAKHNMKFADDFVRQSLEDTRPCADVDHDICDDTLSTSDLDGIQAFHSRRGVQTRGTTMTSLQQSATASNLSFSKTSPNIMPKDKDKQACGVYRNIETVSENLKQNIVSSDHIEWPGTELSQKTRVSIPASKILSSSRYFRNYEPYAERIEQLVERWDTRNHALCAGNQTEPTDSSKITADNITGSTTIIHDNGRCKKKSDFDECRSRIHLLPCWVNVLCSGLSHGCYMEMDKVKEVLSWQNMTDSGCCDDSHNLRLDVSRVHSCKIAGPSADHSKIVPGLLLKTITQSHLQLVQKMKGKAVNTLLVNGDIKPMFKHTGYKPSIRTQTIHTVSSYMEKLREGATHRWITVILDTVEQLAVQALLVSGKVDDSFSEVCDSQGILVVTDVPYSALTALAVSACVDMLIYAQDALQENVCLVSVSLWDDQCVNRIGITSHIYLVVMPTEGSSIQTSVLCHACQAAAAVSEQNFWSCIHRITNVLKSKRLLIGGGAIESTLSEKLDNYAGKPLLADIIHRDTFCGANIKLYQQEALESIAEGLRMFVSIVKQNSCDDRQNVIDYKHFDVDMAVRSKSSYTTNQIDSQDHIYDDLTSKLAAWQTAIDTVCLILRMDSHVITGFTHSQANLNLWDVIL